MHKEGFDITEKFRNNFLRWKPDRQADSTTSQYALWSPILMFYAFVPSFVHTS